MQKPDDLDGVCPFLSSEGPCPYGLACRFASTHKDNNGEVANGTVNGDKRNSEMNVLIKDVQKLLWKNKMKFPKADAALKLLGLLARTRPFTLIISSHCDEYGRLFLFTLHFFFFLYQLFVYIGIFLFILVFWLQGQGKKTKMGDNDNDGQNAANGSEDVDGNGCCRATADSSNELDCSVEVLEEDKPDEADVADELRPPKKTKCSIDETCPVPLNDG